MLLDDSPFLLIECFYSQQNKSKKKPTQDITGTFLLNFRSRKENKIKPSTTSEPLWSLASLSMFQCMICYPGLEAQSYRVGKHRQSVSVLLKFLYKSTRTHN